jgi:hypothetical protein
MRHPLRCESVARVRRQAEPVAALVPANHLHDVVVFAEVGVVHVLLPAPADIGRGSSPHH